MKIYCWVNSGVGSDCQVVMAMAEDGTFLASHLSSNLTWAMHDIGISSDWKHDLYKERYPDGYELVWVENVKAHDGLSVAYALNQRQAEATK